MASKDLDPQEWGEERLQEFMEGGVVTFPSGRVVTFGPQDIVRMIQFLLARQRRSRPKAVTRPEDFILRSTTGEEKP